MIREMIAQLRHVEAHIAELQQQREGILAQISEATAESLGTIRKAQNKETGSVFTIVDGYKVTETITKKVEWDQEKLAAIRAEIVSAGGHPDDYMRAKYDITEKAWDGFDDGTKTALMPARTVKPGKPTIKFEEVK